MLFQRLVKNTILWEKKPIFCIWLKYISVKATDVCLCCMSMYVLGHRIRQVETRADMSHGLLSLLANTTLRHSGTGNTFLEFTRAISDIVLAAVK